MKQFPKMRSDSGFTLIELLISIAVSGIVLAGLVSVFTTSNRAYTRQDETATLQQSLRVAKMNLERDIRMAGCGFGTTFNYLGNQIYPLTNIDADPLNTNSDSLTISYVNYSDPCSAALPQLTPISITGTGAIITVSPGLGSATFPEYALWNTGPLPPCDTGQFLAVYTRSVAAGNATLRMSDVINITGIVSPPYTLRCTGLVDGTPPPNSSINFFKATQLVTVTYSYNSNDRTLTQNAQVLAENIEDLQFTFGLDTEVPPDGNVDSWIYNATMIPAQQTQVRQVIVSIVGRSANPINGHKKNARPAITIKDVDGNDVLINAAGTNEDYHLRQLLQFDVALRNMR